MNRDDRAKVKAVSLAMERYLSNLETLAAAIRPYHLTDEQWQRLGRIIAKLDQVAIDYATVDPDALERKQRVMAGSVFSLHSLECGYPAKGCSCRAVVVG